jgi:hypothetical protein
MKRIALLITANLFVASLLATGDHPVATARSAKNISKEAIASFALEFKNAESVSWETSNDLYFAYFRLNNEQLVAAFDEAGEYISTSRYIEFSDLPLATTLALKNKYPNAQRIGRVVEVAYPGSTIYYFNIATTKHYMRIKSCGDGDLMVTGRQRINKN